MVIRDIPLRTLDKYRSRLLLFLRKYGDQRLTHKALRWLRDLPLGLELLGTAIAVAVHNKQLVGIIAVGKYGVDEAIIAVKPTARKKGVAKQLVSFIVNRLGRMYARVAVDNTASLNLCFSMNMVAFDMFTGVTGKPTLWLGAGDWRREEIEGIINK